jgi:hypothetical protein
MTLRPDSSNSATRSWKGKGCRHDTPLVARPGTCMVAIAISHGILAGFDGLESQSGKTDGYLGDMRPCIGYVLADPPPAITIIHSWLRVKSFPPPIPDPPLGYRNLPWVMFLGHANHAIRLRILVGQSVPAVAPCTSHAA